VVEALDGDDGDMVEALAGDGDGDWQRRWRAAMAPGGDCTR
jgi:hypothetical protein